MSEKYSLYIIHALYQRIVKVTYKISIRSILFTTGEMYN